MCYIREPEDYRQSQADLRFLGKKHYIKDIRRRFYASMAGKRALEIQNTINCTHSSNIAGNNYVYAALFVNSAVCTAKQTVFSWRLWRKVAYKHVRGHHVSFFPHNFYQKRSSWILKLVMWYIAVSFVRVAMYFEEPVWLTLGVWHINAVVFQSNLPHGAYREN